MATISPRSKIVPHLWYTDQALEAAVFYVSLFPRSSIDSILPIPVETPSGPANTVAVVEFTLAGQAFQAIAAGPLDPFNHAISFMVNCDDQAEIDRLWDALAEGGRVEECGWLQDRFGVFWQIVPTALGAMMRDPDRAAAGRAMKALLRMKKIDLAGLEQAFAAA